MLHHKPVKMVNPQRNGVVYTVCVCVLGVFNSCANYRGKQGCTFSQPPYNSLVSPLFVFPDRGCVGGLFSEPTRYRSPLSPLTSPHSLTQSAWPKGGGGVESKNRPHPEWINNNTWRGSNLYNLFTLPFIVGKGIATDPPHSISSIQANNNFTYSLFSSQQRGHFSIITLHCVATEWSVTCY